MSRFIYTLVVIALLPWALIHLLWRARRQPEYLRHWGERFGLFNAVPPAPTLWIHAVSVGETRAAQPLVAALKARYPQHRIVFTHMTPTGRATSESLFGDSVDRIYLPYDTPWAVRRFLHHYRPEFGLIMETELWPNLLAASREAKIPVHLVNARLSARSARRYARFPNLSREALGHLSGVCAQTEADAGRLRELGASKLTITGNLKFDLTVPDEQRELGAELRRRCGDRPVWLAASTREGEEALILEALRKVGGPTGIPLGAGGTACSATEAVLLVIVPRHPQRFDEVTTLAKSLGFKVQRRSENSLIEPDTQVLIGDSMGEMLAYYAMVDIAFVGGSLLDYGSQNLIEPCALGAPVLIGQYTRNFAEAAREAIACKAAKPIETADELVGEALRLLNEPEEQQRMGQAGIDFTTRHRGATNRTLAAITGD